LGQNIDLPALLREYFCRNYYTSVAAGLHPVVSESKGFSFAQDCKASGGKIFLSAIFGNAQDYAAKLGAVCKAEEHVEFIEVMHAAEVMEKGRIRFIRSRD
jgi:hypothetical protein